LIQAFENSIKIINTGIGRDKVCRIIQYFLMFFIPVLKSKGAHMNKLIERLTRLKASMSVTRNVLRFGKEIPLITGMRDRLKQHEKEPVRMLFWRTLSDFALILYFATDHPLYFNKIGFW